MFDEELKATWKKGETATPLSAADIERMLRPAARRTGRALESVVWTYVVMLGATVVLALVNLPLYRTNPAMMAVEAALAAVALCSGAATLALARQLRQMGYADMPLLTVVERRLALAERSYHRWLVVASVTPWMLALAINTLIDNDGGAYRVNHPVEFLVITAAMIGFTYATLRFSTSATVHELRAVAHDLRAEALDATPKLAPARRRARIWLAVAVVLLALGVLAGVLLWLRAV